MLSNCRQSLINLLNSHLFPIRRANHLKCRSTGGVTQYQQHKIRSASYCTCGSGILDPMHFICLKDWNEYKIKNLIHKAMNLKCRYQDTHNTKIKMLSTAKVMLLEDHNEPLERMALSKAVSLLGADEVHITSEINWDHDYYSKVFSEMADIIFVSTRVHGCMKKFARMSCVPVMVMKSRIHSSIQSMATIMSILEEYGSLVNLNVSYIGWPSQVINDYLLLCPMYGANFLFKCSCSVCPVSPLRLDEATCQCQKTHTTVEQCTDTKRTLAHANVIISGPAAKKKDKIPEFTLTVKDIESCTHYPWTYYHTLPRGPEVADELFWHQNARSFNAFRNMQFICAALLLDSLYCQ